jgi:high-affinity Fe2+/Pb2+ permease
MHPLLGLTVHNALRLQEVAGALIAIAGGVMVFGSMMPMGRRGSQWLSGLAFAIAGVLAVIALHWGHK